MAEPLTDVASRPDDATPTAGLGSAYWRIWVASSISVLGDGVRFIAMPLVAASVTHNPIAVSLVSVAGFAPWLLFSLIAGALVDRWDRRRVMWMSDLFRTVVMGGFTAIVAFGYASIPVIVVAAFALGMAETMFDNASQTILPAIVSKDRLARANSRLYAGQIIGMQFAGPPLGGVLFAALVWAPFGVDATSFLIASLLVLSVRGRFREPRDADAPPTKLFAEIGEGVKWLWRQRVLRAFCSMLGIWNLTFNATEAILVLWALEVLHLDARGFGFLGLGAAAGSLAGSLFAERFTKWLGDGPTVYASIVMSIVAELIAFLTHNGFVGGAAFALIGFGSIVWNVLTVSLRQEIIPPRLLGRVNSAYRFVGWGSIPIGALLGGVLAHVWGLRAPFLFATVTLAVCGLLMTRAVTSRSIAAARAEAEARVS
ncbi:MAG: MFS transporter [Actinomycetes bacterium]